MNLRGRIVLASLIVPALLLATTGASPSPSPGPDDFREPTAKEIDDSIQQWDPTGFVKVLKSEPEEEGDETVFNLESDILFAFGSAELSAEARARIAEITEKIPAGTTVSVTGHTDDVGTDADNVTLSQARAQAVASAIGRSDLTLDVQGRGESEPVATNADPEGRQQNRRVEIRYAG